MIERDTPTTQAQSQSQSQTPSRRGGARRETTATLRPRRGPTGLISRVADCCFWVGRYVERAEAVARQLRATLNLALDGELTQRQCWQPAIVVAGEEAAYLAHMAAQGHPNALSEAATDGEAVQRHLVWAPSSPVSLARSVSAARDNARQTRDVLSSEVWESINELHLWMSGGEAAEVYERSRDDFYRRVRQMTQLTLGLLRSTMLHDTVLDFIWLGVMLERTNQTARLLDVHHHAFAAHGNGDGHGHRVAEPHQVVETAIWLALLRACSGVEPFMRSHTGAIAAGTVSRFLVTDWRFPRSIAYCVRAAAERFAYLRPPADVDYPGGASLAALTRLDAWVSGLAPNDGGGYGAAGDLHTVLTRIVNETAAICDTIGAELLGYAPTVDAGGGGEA
jgi:uncharacterized alpha-E superfamily protein